jgi:hypothetical protein
MVVSTFTKDKEHAFKARVVDRPPKQPRKLTVPVAMRRTDTPKPEFQDRKIVNKTLNTIESRFSDVVMNLSDWDIPDSYRGLNAAGLDGEIQFFGVMGSGTHVVFILDFSPSMAGMKEDIMRREAARIINGLLPGTHFAVILFGGIAWPAGQDPDLGNWVVTNGDWQTCRPKDWSALPKVMYLRSSRRTRSDMIDEIDDARLIDGTVYDCPVFMALRMDPLPETIFFMTDGEGDRERGIVSLQKMVAQLEAAGKKVPVMHTVGFGVSSSGQLELMAELMGGECRFLSPWEYNSLYGPSRQRTSGRSLGVNDDWRVESVSADQYPVEFSLQ